MARALRYHPCFESDVLRAADWYDQRSPTLGADFVVRVGVAVEQLSAAPHRRGVAEFGVRYWPLERFPYLVFYDMTDAEILVLGVMHTSQDSTRWLEQRQ